MLCGKKPNARWKRRKNQWELKVRQCSCVCVENVSKMTIIHLQEIITDDTHTLKSFWNICILTNFNEYLLCINCSVNELLNPSMLRIDMHVMKRWSLGNLRWTGTTQTTQFILDGELHPCYHEGQQSASSAFLVGPFHSEPVIQTAEIIWLSYYIGSAVPFNVSFQACDMWLFACSLIALNNQRVVQQVSRHDSEQEWVHWFVLLKNANILGWTGIII